MIRVGIANFKGIQALRDIRILSDAYDSERDTVLVSHIRATPLAVMCVRPMLWVHGLCTNIAPGAKDRNRGTESLFQYALGWGPAAPRLPHGCLFQIDAANDRMEAIANSLGGVEEERSRIFRLDL